MSLYKTATSEDGIGRVVTMPDGTKVFIAAGKEAAADEKPKDEDDDEDEKAVKSPACREDGESEEDCVSRKVPELMDGEGMEEAQAVAAAGRMCSKPCSEKSGPDDEDEDEDEEDEDAKSLTTTTATTSFTFSGGGSIEAMVEAAVAKALAGKGSRQALGTVTAPADPLAALPLGTKRVPLRKKAREFYEKAMAGETVDQQALDDFIEEMADAMDCEIDFEIEV